MTSSWRRRQAARSSATPASASRASSPWPSCARRDRHAVGRGRGLAVGPQGLRRRPAGVAVLPARPTHRQRLRREASSRRRRDPGPSPRHHTLGASARRVPRLQTRRAARSGRDLRRRSAVLHLGRRYLRDRPVPLAGGGRSWIATGPGRGEKKPRAVSATGGRAEPV